MWNLHNTNAKPATNVVRYITNTNQKELEPIIVSNGTEIHGATTAMISQNKIYVGSFADDLLVCDLPIA